MSETLTKEDQDRLADIIWWLIGRLDAGEYRPFGEEHIEALRKARLVGRGVDTNQQTEGRT